MRPRVGAAHGRTGSLRVPLLTGPAPPSGAGVPWGDGDRGRQRPQKAGSLAAAAEEHEMSDTKVVLVTGAGRGMGVDIARAALDARFRVVATARNAQRVTQALG